MHGILGGLLVVRGLYGRIHANRIFPRALPSVSVAGHVAGPPYIQPSSESNPPEALVFR
jgi:hypothetical protein